MFSPDAREFLISDHLWRMAKRAAGFCGRIKGRYAGVSPWDKLFDGKGMRNRILNKSSRNGRRFGTRNIPLRPNRIIPLKYYVLVEFPYPSDRACTIAIRAQLYSAGYWRVKTVWGYNVCSPMGWDAFGLPTENYAMKTTSTRKSSPLKMWLALKAS